MPLDKSIKRVLVIGPGPVVIGRGAEFDYACTQACRTLKEEGVEIVLVNSNPATIMTDEHIAGKVYIEPLTLATIKRIIEKEHPDSILPGFGGQTGLTLGMQLAKEGFFEETGIRLLGSLPEAISKAEDIKAPEEEHVAGWKEIEFEVIRDGKDNAVIVCSMENFDPVGIHTGDSIAVAPVMTLNDRELQMLRTSALGMVRGLGAEGSCNIRFALHPYSMEYAVIEVTPCVSRSSALAGKATGYPIAKAAAKLALGYTLDEIKNAVTGKTYATFEPQPGYIAVKLPKWPFDKFVYANRELGTQMKATGEVMALAETFEEGILKAVRGAELGLTALDHPRIAKKTDPELRAMLDTVTDERLFVLYQAIKRGFNIDDLYAQTRVDKFFLRCLRNIAEADVESAHQAFRRGADPTRSSGLPKLTYKMVNTCAAEWGAKSPYFYSVISKAAQSYDAGMAESENGREAVRDTGRWEIQGGVKSWESQSKAGGADNEALKYAEKSDKPKIVVLGSGPIRIGQGIEFDYACVHCVLALRELGYEAIVINNNPETVSTDFDTADRLYFEPVNIDDVMSVIEVEKPLGVIVTYGGEAAIRLAGKLRERFVPIIGTSAESIAACENREYFHDMLERLSVRYPDSYGATTVEEALIAAERLGYPVIIKPSGVPGSRNMIIAYTADDVREYMEVILRSRQVYPVLIEKYLEGQEIEVDAICDGADILIPGIMEHVERTGIYSGDSIAIYPAVGIDDALAEKILSVTRKLCLALDVKGLVNIKYVRCEDELYVIEVNPRTSRTVPYISKVTGIPMCGISTKVSIGMKLSDMGYTTGFGDVPPYVAAKVPVFSFEKPGNPDTHLSPEMKSTGEVLGIGRNLEEALFKGLAAAGYAMERKGGVLITVRDSDKEEIAAVADKLWRCGFELYATHGTAKFLSKRGYRVKTVEKIHASDVNNTVTLMESGCVNYVISTSEKGRSPARDSVKLRRKACSLGIPCLMSAETANALAEILLTGYSEINTELIDITNLRSRHIHLPFTKMHGCGNDYIYINCFDIEINSPESLSVFLSDRNKGIGGDGVILIMPSEVADAKMRMFNLDGSEGSMCGNGIRCVGKYLYDSGMVRKLHIRVETKSGIKDLYLSTRNEKVSQVKVDMGRAGLKPANIPVALRGKRVVAKPVTIGGEKYEITCVSMGNPHAVVFTEQVDKLDLAAIGPLFEHNELFPDRVNAGFAEVVGRNRLKLRVWERGSGETKACGTGACAAAVASVLCGHCDKGADIKVQVRGGELVINYTDEAVMLTGEAVTVYRGVVEV